MTPPASGPAPEARTVYVTRPTHTGAWSFVIREGSEAGDVVARVDISRSRADGTIHIGEVPFEMGRAGSSNTYRLRFEGQPLARAEMSKG